MKDFDELIGRALTDEDRALLARHGEPGYFTQALGLFRGPSAWVMWVLYATTLVAFAGALAALWQTWHATDAVVAVRWGVLALFGFQVVTLCKMVMGGRLESGRLARDLKRVELQVALLRDDRR